MDVSKEEDKEKEGHNRDSPASCHSAPTYGGSRRDEGGLLASCRPASYDLLNLGLVWEDFNEVLQRRGVLFRWSSNRTPAEWTKQEARLNPQTHLPRRHPKRSTYENDVVFTFKGMVFLVDLLHGAIVCDMLSGGNGDYVELDFVHLPAEYQGRYFERYSNPKVHRTMGRVGDSIKFICIVTINGDTPRKDTPPGDVVLRC
uniref:DUF1618 domain-containing protein n=1 Tax=Aegilops tauschii TaxID=37682 RepID=M8CK44_AEGTA